ncbi:MAG: hypothetical protein KME50_07845 [Nostoc desertorum CM1-VF14]|nr:hypothetical protein [Nostoc desertorum CM1-VF14]
MSTGDSGRTEQFGRNFPYLAMSTTGYSASHLAPDKRSTCADLLPIRITIPSEERLRQRDTLRSHFLSRLTIDHLKGDL